MKVGIIYLGIFNIHPSINQIFTEYILYRCSSRKYEEITALYTQLKQLHNTILITDDFVFDPCIYKMSYHKLDYVGGDYYAIHFKTTLEMFESTKDDSKAIAFNTKGYIKNFIEMDKLQYNNFLEGGGIYIYTNKLNTINNHTLVPEIENGLYICPSLIDLACNLTSSGGSTCNLTASRGSTNHLESSCFYVVNTKYHKTQLIDTGKYKYLIYNDDYIGSCLYNYGMFSPYEIYFLRDLIIP